MPAGDWGEVNASVEQGVGVFYRARVKDVMSTSVAITTAEATAQDMAMRMREARLGALVVVDGDAFPIGMVTERDLVYKVLPTAEVDMTARDIMSSPPITIRPDEHLYEAMYLMMHHRVRRLVVVDAVGRLAAFLSIQDLLRLEGYEGQVLSNRIAKAPTIADLCDMRTEIGGFIRKLYLGDVDGRSLVEVLTDYNDGLTRRALTLAQQRLRPEHRRPPGSFAWVCFGSEGRREQVMRGDQDNGIIIADNGDPQTLDYYRRMAEEVNEDLDQCGFELCKGGVMAREDKYFGTLSQWKERVYAMIHGHDDGILLRDLSIFLDLRRVDGNQQLVDELWDFTLDELSRSPYVLRALAQDAAAKPVPLNFIGRLQFEKTQSGRKAINIKRYGFMPLVETAKVLAVQEGLRVTSTAERLRSLRGANIVEEATIEKLFRANEFLLKLKIQSSLSEAFHADDEEHFIFPEEWTEWERHSLKQAFKAIDHLTDVLRFRYQL